MGLSARLGKLFGKPAATSSTLTADRAWAAPASRADMACPHTVLVPRWDAVQDIGHEDRATGYTCEACQQTFTAPEGQTLRQTEAERLRQLGH